MKLLFCHDGPIDKYENNYFSLGFNDELFDRYSIISDNISIAMRVRISNKPLDKKKYLKLSSKYNVIECPNISSIIGQLTNKRLCKKILSAAIIDSDLIIIRLPSMIGYLAFNICKKYHKKIFVEMVGCPLDSLWYHSFRGKLMAPISFIQTRKCVWHSDYVLYVTDKFLQRRYPTKGKQIGCSDVKILKMNEKKDYKHIDLGDNITLGTIGVLDIAYKGQKYVIKAMKLLKKQGFNVTYELVGSGSFDKLATYAKKHNVSENVRIIGQMNHDNIFDWLNHIDIYIQPSNTEGMPRSLIEAMSVGCLCISSNAGGMPELLDSRFVFKKKNWKELFKIIESLQIKDFISQSKRNYDKSLDFSEEKLISKRNNFLLEYKNYVIKNSNKGK